MICMIHIEQLHFNIQLTNDLIKCKCLLKALQIDNYNNEMDYYVIATSREKIFFKNMLQVESADQKKKKKKKKKKEF